MTATFDRRQFLATGMTMTAGAMAASLPAAQAADGKKITLNGQIPTRDFGKTGLKMPVLGHGGSALIDHEAKYYGIEKLGTMDERVAMVRAAYDKGVRYFDTARIYAESEEIFGRALGDVKDDVYIASKVLVNSPEKVRESVETSLATMKLDRIDCMQIHGPSIENLKYEGCMKLYDELAKLREEKLFKYIGLTGHNAFEEMYKMIATNQFDQVLIEYGYFKKGYNTRHSETSVEWREACLAKAGELKMAVVAMKVLGAWIYSHNAPKMVEAYDPAAVKRLPAAAIRWVLDDPRVSVLNIGVSLPTDVDDNIRILAESIELTNDDRLLLADFSAKAYQHESIQKLPVV